MRKAFYLILAGVAIGILLAPDKGTETLRKIKEGINDWKDRAQDHLRDIVSQGEDLVDKGKEMVESSSREVGRAGNE